MTSNASIHSRPTRIVRRVRDDRKTLVCVAKSGELCHDCLQPLDVDAQFCGMCGERIRGRVSLIGTTIAELYRVEELIAEGKTATIYRACYLPSGIDVALKVLHPELARDPIASERFRREGKCLARLRDQHTVAVYDHGEDADGTVYLAMELLCGEGLDTRIRTRGAMPWREALAVLRAVCTSLAEAHAHGIVHRNLESSNIRLGAGDSVKVIDFGLAKLRPDASDEELTYAGQAVGTLAYMAPEQLAGGTCDGRADLYALGVVALELLLGRPRVPGSAPALLPAEVPDEVEALLVRCLAPVPGDRFTSATELGLAIDRALTPVAPRVSAPRKRVFANTPAFELQPPRIVIDAPVEHVDAPVRPSRWRLWAVALVVAGVGLGSAVAGCV